MEWFVVVGIAKKHVRGQNRLDSVESILTFSRPSNIARLLRGKSSQWSEDVSMFRKHSTVVGHGTDEGAKVLGRAWMLKVQDGVDLLAPGLEPSRCKPGAQEIGLLHSPFTFAWVDTETIILQAGHYLF